MPCQTRLFNILAGGDTPSQSAALTHLVIPALFCFRHFLPQYIYTQIICP